MANKTFEDKSAEDIKKDFFDLRRDTDKRIASKSIKNIIVWVILFIWMSFCIIDLVRVENRKKPIFCVYKKTYKYQDGVVDSYFGLGYKVNNYKLDNLNGFEFGPFWLKNKNNS